MLSAIYDRFCYLMNLDPTENNESEIREELNILLVQLHAFYDRQQLESSAALHEMERACHHRLRLLQNRLMCRCESGQMYVCDINEMAENICCACDLALSPKDRGVIFDSKEGDVLISCNPGIISSILLNMISNACLHTAGSLIKVKLRHTDCGVMLKTSSKGKIDLESLSSSFNTVGSGAAAMLSGARLHKASIMWCNTNENACCALCLPVGEVQGDHYTPQDFVELLCDRLSVVYTGLCGII
ncbi:MAG: HAMP domain-containing histidine kinase [Clostridiales bacterium]|nr:HAMP domain-containing histidine kinase [Clostridiales bacterium]